VRRHPARPGIKSLTNCQGNRTRVGVKTVRRHPAGPGIKSLTPYQGNSCQGNRTRVLCQGN
ncbi:hypothetical protein V8B97DRAFT_1947039, partial [Scleroderma yunnanense]